MSPGSPPIEIRPPRSFEELDGMVHLQKIVWNAGDLDAEGRPIFVVAQRFSGQVLGAFTPDGSMIGFSLAFADRQPGHIHSHRVAVLPEWQNAGIGRALKLAQREHALRAGFSVMHWTFDPMQDRNAWFNLVRLGATSHIYIRNIYGITASPLHAGLPTDRLLLEWDLQGERALRALAGEIIAGTKAECRIPLPPLKDRTDAAAQSQLRLAFEEAFASGLTVTGFDRDQQSYLLERR
ncbi:MAG: GNAT family N-acetyltransferase [Edaphobacter sp.]|uniref:GNAT family N-acetyltransferase n=1 Tax=Edaphobacter sp. TaxID=1934404 RepID=UPI00239D4692|nr:GNAT family N-acetyltransferase [Edaphobacter sp.]MDE1175829.1 GNAT family N-acetyltransferase [Edaphobacter sp.]